MQIEAVLFDLDDTLYDERAFVQSGFHAVSHFTAQRFGLKANEFYHLLLQIFTKQGRDRVFDKALETVSLYQKATVQEMVQIYRSHIPNITISSSDRTVLSMMTKKYHLALITDGLKAVQENKVNALKLAPFFRVITYATEHGGKHTIQPFQHTLTRLNVTPSASVYVDDDPRKGLPTAQQLGIHPVQILPRTAKKPPVEKTHAPYWTIERLDQLEGVIKAIEDTVNRAPCETVKKLG